MEYIRPLSRPSLLQRLRVLLLDLLFVVACLRRFADDHFRSAHSPQPQPIEFEKEHKPAYLSRRGSKQQPVDDDSHSAGVSKRGSKQQAPVDDDSDLADSATRRDPSVAAATASPPTAALPSSSSPSPPLTRQLRVLSLNIWGLPISPRTALRTSEVAKSLHLFDVVAFQELTHEREVTFLRHSAADAGLLYSHQFTNGVGFPIWHGVTAPGLVVFSRFPIIDAHFKRFSINGKLYQLAHSDYMGAKGVGLVRVDVSALAYPDAMDGCKPVIGVDVFLTHLHANYTDFFYDYRKMLPLLAEANRRQQRGETVSPQDSLPIPLLAHVADEYLAHRVLQSYECARFISAYRREDFLTILCGDLNCPPYDLVIQVIQSLTFGQSVGAVPRFIDSFRELHPHSNGFTCGATDNSFTFSAEPLRMERRVFDNVADQTSSASSLASGPLHFRSVSGTASERARFNSSPTDPALVPIDLSHRGLRTTHGEHVTLLPSSSPLPPLVSDASSPPPPTLPPAQRSPLAWVDEETPKRIDYILYTNPVAAIKCSCEWSRMQLPFQSVGWEERTAAAQSCSCTLPTSPGRLWSVRSAAIFKQYMIAPDGKMTSISDHHGISVTFDFTPDLAAQQRTARAISKDAKQAQTSIIILSQIASDEATAPSSAASTPAQSPVLVPLRKKKLVDGSGAEEEELFTLDEASAATPATSARSMPSNSLAHPVTSITTALSPSSASLSSGTATPVLPTASILLLAEGVLWFGLRDASDRRAAHLRRMKHAFLIFLIGSRTMWAFVFSMYFENILASVTPLWLQALPFPLWFLAALRLALFLIDWAHTFLPIYIVAEYLLTTFPAKEEQSTLRETIAEMRVLREFDRNQSVRRGKQASSGKQKPIIRELQPEAAAEEQ